MIQGKNINTVFLSELLQTDSRFADSCNRIVNLLRKNGVTQKFLKATKDIWCRDYMPIQTDKGKFVQFRYEPSYLKDDLSVQSEPKEVCKENGLQPEFSEINLDGGNVVNWVDRAIISDRVFKENPHFENKTKLVSEIEELLGVEIIVIPQINSDYTGHADGLVRFIDRNTVLGNDREFEYKYWKKGINKVLKANGIEYIDIPFFEYKNREYPDNAIGCYVNFLEVDDLIVLPIFEVENNKDEEVYQLFEQIYPDRKIEAINFNEVGKLGGLLNCTTWTIYD